MKTNALVPLCLSVLTALIALSTSGCTTAVARSPHNSAHHPQGKHQQHQSGRVSKASYEQGFEEGISAGYEQGFRDGHRQGYEQASAAAHHRDYSQGHSNAPSYPTVRSPSINDADVQAKLKAAMRKFGR